MWWLPGVVLAVNPSTLLDFRPLQKLDPSGYPSGAVKKPSDFLIRRHEVAEHALGVHPRFPRQSALAIRLRRGGRERGGRRGREGTRLRSKSESKNMSQAKRSRIGL